MSTTFPSIKKQQGVSIVTAIFLIVVLALLASAMVSIFTTSQQSISQELTSAKAYFAGRSALEWGMYQSIYDDDVIAPGIQTLTFNSAGLTNTGSSVAFVNISADGNIFYTITSNANYGIATDPEFSQRRLQLQFQP